MARKERKKEEEIPKVTEEDVKELEQEMVAMRELIDEIVDLAVEDAIGHCLGYLVESEMPIPTKRGISRALATRIFEETIKKIDLFYNSPDLCDSQNSEAAPASSEPKK